MKGTYSHIDLNERRKMARWRMAGMSVGIIADKPVGIARRSFERSIAT